MAPEDAELQDARIRRCRSMEVCIAMLEARSRALALEANEIRKLMVRTKEIIAAVQDDPLRGDAKAAQ